MFVLLILLGNWYLCVYTHQDGCCKMCALLSKCCGCVGQVCTWDETHPCGAWRSQVRDQQHLAHPWQALHSAWAWALLQSLGVSVTGHLRPVGLSLSITSWGSSLPNEPGGYLHARVSAGEDISTGIILSCDSGALLKAAMWNMPGTRLQRDCRVVSIVRAVTSYLSSVVAQGLWNVPIESER